MVSGWLDGKTDDWKLGKREKEKKGKMAESRSVREGRRWRMVDGEGK